MSSRYNKFKDWMRLKNPGIVLTGHQHKLAKSWLDNISFEELGVRDSAHHYGKKFVLLHVDKFLREINV